MTNRLRLALLMGLCLAWASSAHAQAGLIAQTTLGVRAGVSGDPDQFVIGGHLETKPLLKHLTFKPNLEAGFGDDSTLVAVNFEFAYRIDLDQKPWWIYIVAGPAAVWSHPDGGDTDFGGGFNIGFGVQHRKGLFAELKFGLADSPDVKFMVGYAFKNK